MLQRMSVKHVNSNNFQCSDGCYLKTARKKTTIGLFFPDIVELAHC